MLETSGNSLRILLGRVVVRLSNRQRQLERLNNFALRWVSTELQQHGKRSQPPRHLKQLKIARSSSVALLAICASSMHNGRAGLRSSAQALQSFVQQRFLPLRRSRRFVHKRFLGRVHLSGQRADQPLPAHTQVQLIVQPKRLVVRRQLQPPLLGQCVILLVQSNRSHLVSNV